MKKPTRIVEDGPYRTAPLAASLAAILLGAAALWLAPLAFELPSLSGPPAAAAKSQSPDDVTTTPRNFDDEDRAELGIDSPLLADLREQERTMVEARAILPSDSILRGVFESDLASVRKQIEAEEVRLRTLDLEGYTPEVVCGDRPC
ncbi:MAG: hypothetical protein JNJ73_17710 [Hyphomonadaceae bacterium]|nr:hypothetical protein [Hyphomonadaceae bacterium]